MTDAAAGPTGAAGPGAAGPGALGPEPAGATGAAGTAPENGRAGAAPPEPVVRRARTGDVRQIRDLIETYRGGRRMLSKPLVTLYEDVQEFRVAAHPGDDTVLGCGALHVMWEDLAEIRSVAVHPDWRGHRIGHRIVAELLDTAREIGVSRVFVLTFETRFFGGFGFVEIDGAPVPHAVYEQLLRSYDEGVAEFLDLERVKPNTLGNVRMLLRL